MMQLRQDKPTWIECRKLGKQNASAQAPVDISWRHRFDVTLAAGGLLGLCRSEPRLKESMS